MADPTLVMAPIGPGIAFVVPMRDSSAEPSPQASPALPFSSGLGAAATPNALPAADATSPAVEASEKLEHEAPDEVQGSATAPVPPLLPRRHAPQRKQRAGTFVQPWLFSFEPLTMVKGGGSRGAAPPAQPPPKKKPTRKVHAIAATTPTTESGAAPSPESGAVPAPAPARQPGGYRRQHGAIHTPRVDFLLKKYLGDRSQELVEPAAAAEEPAAIPALPPVAKAVPLPVPGLKRIIQVKTEQDAAIAAIQAKPRQFRARPVPLEVAETTASRQRVGGIGTAAAVAASAVVLQDESHAAVAAPHPRSSIEKTVSQENSGDERQWRARPVPPASAEPRYAEIVADSVLRRYSNREISGDTGESKGLQKWLSWPGEQAEAVALTATAMAAPPARPQSARPRGSSSGGHQVLHLPDIVEEGDETKI